jgi:hypothetical protein
LEVPGYSCSADLCSRVILRVVDCWAITEGEIVLRIIGPRVVSRVAVVCLGAGAIVSFSASSFPASAQSTAPNEWTWVGGSVTFSSPTEPFGPPRRVWHAGNASGGQHPRRSRQRSDLERQGWQFLALRRRRRGCQWKLWPTERPLGVSALYTAMDLDGRKQRAAVQLRRQRYGSLRPTGNLRHRWRCRCFEYAGRPFRSSVLD